MISSITTPDALPATLPRDVTVPPVPGFLSHAAATATAALQENAARMDKVITALKAAGFARRLASSGA